MKTENRYVPLALGQQAKAWVEQYKRLKSIIKEIADAQKMIVRCYVREKGRGSAGQQ